MKRILSTGLVVGVICASGAWAADGAAVTQRDVNQQDRIEAGLKSGQLTTGEAARLEHKEGTVDRMEARDMKDGKLTAAETAKINAAQNRVSQDIYRQKHDAQAGNPDSASSQRMQADVQRNANQEARIGQGLKSGALNGQEAARLERGQAKVDQGEARAGANGHVSAGEQREIRHAQKRQSRQIHRKKHD